MFSSCLLPSLPILLYIPSHPLPLQRYSCQPNVTVAPHVQENREILEQAISESHVDGPPPTAHASPGGIRDKSVQNIVQRKPALNEFPEFPGASRGKPQAEIEGEDEEKGVG